MNQRISHHLLLCATPTKAKCCDPEIGAASWDALKRLVRELDLENPSRAQGIVLRSKADCLRICEQGPILLVWPDGTWYGGVTPERIHSILHQHIIQGQPIEDWVLKTSPFTGGSGATMQQEHRPNSHPSHENRCDRPHA